MHKEGKYGNALQAASYTGHEAIAKLLLEQGADVNAQGGEYGHYRQHVMETMNSRHVVMGETVEVMRQLQSCC
jgi:ankyrin repeat protein